MEFKGYFPARALHLKASKKACLKTDARERQKSICEKSLVYERQQELTKQIDSLAEDDNRNSDDLYSIHA